MEGSKGGGGARISQLSLPTGARNQQHQQSVHGKIKEGVLKLQPGLNSCNWQTLTGMQETRRGNLHTKLQVPGCVEMSLLAEKTMYAKPILAYMTRAQSLKHSVPLSFRTHYFIK